MRAAGFEPASASARPGGRAAGFEPVSAWSDNVGWGRAELEPGSVRIGLTRGCGGGEGRGRPQVSKRWRADDGWLDETGRWEGGTSAKGEERGSSRGRAGGGAGEVGFGVEPSQSWARDGVVSAKPHDRDERGSSRGRTGLC